METGEKLEVTILYVEDEASTRNTVSASLARKVKTVLQAENGKEGLEIFRQHRPDLVITDIRMPKMDGLTMAREIKALEDRTQVLVTTAHGDTKYLLEAIDIGIDRYVLKPIDYAKLFSAIDKCVAIINLEKEAQQHQKEREKLIIELQDALLKIKTLSGMLPICATCKKIRDDKGYWSRIENYISEHSDVLFSHGICPECEKKAYAELDRLMKGERNA